MMMHWIVPEKTMTQLWLMSSERLGMAATWSIFAHTAGVDTVKMAPSSAIAALMAYSDGSLGSWRRPRTSR